MNAAVPMPQAFRLARRAGDPLLGIERAAIKEELARLRAFAEGGPIRLLLVGVRIGDAADLVASIAWTPAWRSTRLTLTQTDHGALLGVDPDPRAAC